MSVSLTGEIHSRRWFALWPLSLFLLLALVGAYWLWLLWPQVMSEGVIWQREVSRQMSALLKTVAANPAQAGGSLLLFSFVYGILHALGPGHGKVVIATWLATHRAKVKLSIGLTLSASLLQGLVAIGLVVLLLSLLQLSARQLYLSSHWLEKGSYLLVGVLGGMLCWRAIKRLSLLLCPRAAAPQHVHHAGCGCGCHHIPDVERQSSEDWRACLMIVLSMGMRPCSGAIMVLLFSKVIGVFGWGVASALAMAAGTALTTTSLALLVISFRQLAVKISGNRAPRLWRRVGWATLALTGGVLLLVAALVMYLSVPQPGGGLRLF